MARKRRSNRFSLWPHPTWSQRIRRDFLTGLVIVLPVFLTVYLVWAVVGFVDAQVMPLLPAAWRPDNIFGVGLIIFLVFTTILGATTKGIFGRQLIHFGERLVDRMPVIRSIYNGAKQIVETILSQSSGSFSMACLVQYPREGIWAIAFVATEARGEVPIKAGESELLAVFLPTTPNPTSGFLLYVPRREVVLLDMTVEEAAKLIISGGLVAPPTKAEIAAGRQIAAA